MKVGVSILVYNPIHYLRFDLFEKTLESIRVAFHGADILAIDNGSTDGTEDIIAELDVGFCYKAPDGNTSPGRGASVAIQKLIDRGADLIIQSDDDMFWKPESMDVLLRIWQSAPEDLIIVSGLLEPCWPWNTPRERIEIDGIPVLVRDSVPGGSWSFLTKNWSKFFPIQEHMSFDHATCKNIRAQGGRFAQLDLVEHMGWDVSTWDNKAIKTSTPLDREFWRI